MENIEKRAERLRQAMRLAGIAEASELARRTGLVANTVRTHLLGRRGFKLDAAERYARVLNVSVAWLLAGEEVRRPDPSQIPPPVPSRIPVVGKLRNQDEEYLALIKRTAKDLGPLIAPRMSIEELAWRLQVAFADIAKSQKPD